MDNIFLSTTLFLIAGIAAGIMNTVGGGGSIFTLPVMIFMGIPGGVANATNRLGVVAQNAISVFKFRQAGIKEDELSWKLIIPSLLGTLIGAWMAATIPDRQFELILAIIMLILLIPIIMRPKPHGVGEGTSHDLWLALSSKRRLMTRITFFGIGIFMGFLQAGTGIMILAALSYFIRLDLVRGNYVKVLFIFVLNFVSVGYFLFSGVEIAWIAGLTLAVGQFIGGWSGVWITLKIGDKWILRALVVSIVVSSIGLFYKHFGGG